VNQILASLLPGGLPPPPPFPPDSRYHAVPVLTATIDGREVRYLARRIVPLPESFAQIGEHVVQEDERPDTIAAAFIGNAELWWSICDANGVLHPVELTETIGRHLRITLPAGIAGPGSFG
jgi:hypothetical protein